MVEDILREVRTVSVEENGVYQFIHVISKLENVEIIQIRGDLETWIVLIIQGFINVTT